MCSRCVVGLVVTLEAPSALSVGLCLALHPAAQRVARLPGEERMRHVRADRWIGYTRATDALARLETLFDWPARQRMPNLLLIGLPTTASR